MIGINLFACIVNPLRLTYIKRLILCSAGFSNPQFRSVIEINTQINTPFAVGYQYCAKEGFIVKKTATYASRR